MNVPYHISNAISLLSAYAGVLIILKSVHEVYLLFPLHRYPGLREIQCQGQSMSAKTYLFLCAQKEYLVIHLIAVRNNIQDQNKVTEYRMMWQRV